MASLLKIAASLAGLGALGIGGLSWATHWAPKARFYPLQGIDLGERPPAAIEWGTIRAGGADFAYLTATSGADRRDPVFEAHWAALPEAGLRRGAVHVYSLCQSAVAQANAFNTFVPRAADALPVALDLAFHDDCAARPERGPLIADIRSFAARVEAHTGRPIVLRVSRAFEQAYGVTAAIDRPVWAVANFLAPRYTARPWRLWRATDMRRIDGIDQPVNWDVVAP